MIKKNGGIFGRNPTYNDVVVEGVLTLKEAQVFDNDITINGDLTVNGTETVINTVELNVDDKNITMGAVVAKVGLAATTNITAGQFIVQLADTSGLIPGMTVTKTAGTGAFGVGSKIASIDSHTQITLTVAHATSGTIIFDTGGATDDTADGGGITLKGTTDKFIKWVKASVAWVFSDPIKAPDVTVDNLTASKAVFTDANKKLTSTGTLAVDQGGTGAATLTGYVKGNGTGAMTASATVPNTDVSGLGTMSTQAANNVAITGGAVDGVSIGATTAATIANVDNLRLDGNTLSSTNTNGFIAILPNGTGPLLLRTSSNPNVHNVAIGGTTHMQFGSNNNIEFFGPNTGTGARIFVRDGAGTQQRLELQGASVNMMLTSGATSVQHDGTTGNVSVNYGNLVIGTSGKGIDFSVNPSGGASINNELLADYEWGTWTPQYTNATPPTTPYPMFTSDAGYATYVKVGNMVTLRAQIFTNGSFSTAGASGALQISGLPFVVSARGTSSISVSRAANWAGDYPAGGFAGATGGSASTITLQFRTASNGAFSDMDAADMQTTAAFNNILTFTVTYFTDTSA